MDHRILVLPETSVPAGMHGETMTLPVIPGVQFIVPGSILSLFGEIIRAPKGAANGWTRELIGFAVPIAKAPGTYRVWAKQADLDKMPAGETQAKYLVNNRAKITYWEITGTMLDPMSGKTITVTRVVELATVPATDATPAKPWIVQDITAPHAEPGLQSEIGGYGMKTALLAVAASLGDDEVTTYPLFRLISEPY